MPSDVKQLIAEINRAVTEEGFNLSEWGAEFLESITRQTEAGLELSDKQDAVLERIWRKATGRSK